MVALAIGGLFLWKQFGDTSALNHDIVVPFIPGVLALATAAIVLLSYFVAPLQRLSASAYLNYILILATLTLLVTQTGGVTSAFLSLLIVVLPFGSFLGLGGVVVSTLAFVAMVVSQYLTAEITSSQMVVLSAIGGIALIGGFILWSKLESPEKETKEDKSYHELANELSAVAGKSEVVITAITDGVLALNGQGVVELINPAAQQMLGWGKHDALNLSYKSILKVLDSKNQAVEEVNDPVAQALNSNKTVKTESFSLQTQSGKSFLAAITVSPVGQLGKGVIVVFRDITIEKSDERQRAEFISTASHEMRTPVASIEGYLGLVLNPQTATIDEKARDFVTKAHESAQHLGRLFADLLDVSKADDSRLKNDPKVVDVVPFIHDIVEGLTPKADEKGLRVIFKPLPDGDVSDPVRKLNPVFYANVDNDHLREVVQNLVENAIKYTLKGEVVIDITGDDEHITISVVDSGIGIPREDQAHLFQKFYRVDNSDTREIGGTGLGLYLCRRLTETIGGRIWVESEYKQGSTFYVEIPRIDHDEATRLIEQASIDAEKQAEIEQQQAAQAAAAEPQPVVDSTPPAPFVSSAPSPAAPPAQPSPVAPVQPPAQVAAPQPTPASPVTPQPVNTPLSAIEANPSQYLNRSDNRSINVPPRQ